MNHTTTNASHSYQRPIGFTIVELLIVIVVIAILAALSYVGYATVSGRAKESLLRSDLKQAQTKLNIDKVTDGSFPSSTTGVTKSADTQFEYSTDGNTFCLTATMSGLNKAFHITDTGSPTEVAPAQCSTHTVPSSGGGQIADGALMQTITSANCPDARVMAIDARDSHTYWVQKLADGKCWMLTNLAYGGGGENTYNDTKSLVNGEAEGNLFTAPRYYVPAGANMTIAPTQPSISTSGTGQYGYLYNWCAAMGGQAATSACMNAATPLSSASISICPAGWRLPTGNGGELGALNIAVNGGATNTDAGLRSVWLAQRGGYWYAGFNHQGSTALYWSSTQYSGPAAYALNFNGAGVNATYAYNKPAGYAVRCVAQ